MARCYYERLYIEPSCEPKPTDLVTLSRQNYFLKLKHFLEDSDSPKVPAVKRRMICEIDIGNSEVDDFNENKRIKIESQENKESVTDNSNSIEKEAVGPKIEPIQINENIRLETDNSNSIEKEAVGPKIEPLQINENIRLETDNSNSIEKEAVGPTIEPVQIDENNELETDYETENQENVKPKSELISSQNDQGPKMNQFNSPKKLTPNIISRKRKTIFKKRTLAENSNGANMLESTAENKTNNTTTHIKSEAHDIENSDDMIGRAKSDIDIDQNDQSLSDTDIVDDISENDSDLKIDSTDSNSNSNDASCPKTYKCDQCEFECNAKALLTRHMRKHATTKKHQCDQCEYATNELYHLKRHKLQHSDIKSFKCSHCDFFSMKMSEIKTHEINEHLEGVIIEDGIFKCKFCEYTHQHLSKLKTHMSKHTGLFKFNCDKCSYSTTQNKHLERHMNTHKSEYKCIDCPYTTTQMDDYKAHRNIHKIVGFICDKCDFKTMRSDVMDTHKLNHVNLTLFNCEECDYGTNYSSHMRRHTAKHERDRLKPEKPPKPAKLPKTPKTPKPKPVKEKKAKDLLSNDKQEEYDELLSKIKAIDNILSDDEKLA